MRIIITGATGTIGSVLMECLSKKYEVIGINKKNKIINFIREGDIVIHLARDNNDLTDTENERITKESYESAFKSKASLFILASSVYVNWRDYQHLGKNGEHQPSKKKILITDEPNPLTMYGVQKSYFERIGKQYSEKGLRVIAARFGNVTKNDEHSAYPFSLSHRDLCQFIEKCITAKNLPMFSAYFVTSNNECNPFDLSNAKTELGYDPKDSSPCPLINN